MKTIVNVPSRQNTMRELRDYLMIALGMVLYGIGWTVFLLPNDITTGGVPGIASIVYFATGFPVQYTYFAINFLLLLLALRVLGWKFSVKTIFACIHPDLFPFHYPETDRWVLSSCTTSLSWLVSSVPPSAVAASASPFSNNGSTGGTGHHCRRNQQVPRHHAGQSHVDM